MSMQTDLGGGSTADAAKEQASKLASTVHEQGSMATDSVQQGGQRVAREARVQAGKLNEEAQKQVHAVFEQAREELGGRADDQTEKAAANLRGFAEEFHALADGRTGEASRLVPYVRQMGDQASDFAIRLETGGFAGTAADLSTFARRRPGVFLLGALAAGFATARLVRGAQQASAPDASAQTELSPSSFKAEAPSLLAPDEPYVDGFDISSSGGAEVV